MALPREYTSQDCPVARSLEVIGERWTLLIIRDAFYGVTRFSDFRDELDIPRAVLTERLNLLVEHGILARATAASGRDEYTLTDKGLGLWPTVWSLISWGNEHYVPSEQRREFTHADDGGAIADDGTCLSCGAKPALADQLIHPGRHGTTRRDTGRMGEAMSVPHRLLAPME
jgi:DNA-binding HxlR family transcriptional regulator